MTGIDAWRKRKGGYLASPWLRRFSVFLAGLLFVQFCVPPEAMASAIDTLGRSSKKIDFKGQATEMAYDTLGRVNAQNYYAPGSASPDETIQMVYDDLGRQQQIVEPRGTTECSYDSNGQMVIVATPEGTIHYEYDPTTGRKTRTWTANSDQRYTYDTLGRLKTVEVYKRNAVQLTTPEVTTYNYTAVGSRSGVTLPNGVKTSYEYNDLNRLTALTHKNSSDDLLASYAYTLAPNGRRTGIAEQRKGSDGALSATNVAFTYDKLNRLVNEASTSTITSLNFTTSYAYDLNGNRLKKATASDTITYTYNNNDQLIQENSTVDGVTDYAYDANGSQTLKSGSRGVYNYLYNLQSRLSSATIQRTESSHSVHIAANYGYNASGIRVRSNSVQTVDGAATTNNRSFLVDSNNPTGYAQVFEEFNGVSTAPVKSYTLGDDVLSQCVNGVVGHLLYDGHGSTRMLTGSSGSITDRFDFDAYGIQLGQTPNVTTPGSTDMLYSGEQFDPELQQQYLRARYYDQSNGRFSQLDPFGGNSNDPQSLHKYAYCNCDPMNRIDPSGNFGLLELCIIALAVATIGFTMLSIAKNHVNPGISFPKNDLDLLFMGTSIGLVGTDPVHVLKNTYMPNQHNIYHLGYTNPVGDMLRVLKGYNGSKNLLVIASHGSPGVIHLSGGGFFEDTESTTTNSIFLNVADVATESSSDYYQLMNKLKEWKEIYFFACDVAGTQEAWRGISRFSTFTGAKIHASQTEIKHELIGGFYLKDRRHILEFDGYSIGISRFSYNR